MVFNMILAHLIIKRNTNYRVMSIFFFTTNNNVIGNTTITNLDSFNASVINLLSNKQ